MGTRFVAFLAALGLASASMPAVLPAQIGIAVKGGTLGLGPEVSLAAGNHIAVRGGIGFIPLEPKRSFSDIDYTLNPPSGIWNVGVDLYPGLGGLRLSAGVMHWPQYDLTATQTGTTSVGGSSYTGTVKLNAAVTNASTTAPFLAFGFGRTAHRGFGVFMDFGVAFVGEANIDLTGTCTLSNGSACPGNFQADLQAEAADAEADIGKYLELLPILQIGFKVGVGGSR